MRRLLKFLHTVAGAGLTGAAAALTVMLTLVLASPGSAPTVLAMAQIATWIVGPSVVLTVATGLLAMVATPAFQDRGWVWAKAATGILVLLGGLHVIGPIQAEARRVTRALANGTDTAGPALLHQGEITTLWVLLGVSVANIALGVWRPRFPDYPV